MKKIRVGVCKNIDIKIKKFSKNISLEYMSNKINYDAIIVTPLTILDYKKINKSKKIKLIFIMSLHLITKINIKQLRKDIKVLYFDKKNNFSILNNITATPEFIFGLIILLTRNFLNLKKQLKKNIWNPRQAAGLSSEKMLSNSTLGIIGYGRIGKKLKSIANSFGLKTLIYSKHNKSNMRLKKIAKNSDIVTINLSLNKKNEKFINKSFFKFMKLGSYFINTSKGKIVDYNHLLKFLGKNISGAALDVFEVEKSNDPGLIKLCKFAKKNRNLILTPHIAGSTADSIIQLQNRALELIERSFKKRHRYRV